MWKNFFSLLISVVLCVGISFWAYAQEKAKDDKAASPVDPAPVAFWAVTLPKVEGKIEQYYDINRDKILQTSETKIFLRDVAAEVLEKNSFNVSDSLLLKAYDKNKDGVINKFELEEITKDLSY